MSAPGQTLVRCAWAKGDLYCQYHDEEWGVAVHDDRRLFEMLILEGAQAGLSWETVLKKRENYRKAFDGFDPKRVARYGEARIETLLKNEGLIRNRLKMAAAVRNAQRFLETQQEFGSFDAYIWQFTGGGTKRNAWKTKVPATTRESDAMSKDLARRGFKFVGSTICYAFMQAVGMVNDHLTGCYRWAEIDAVVGEAGQGASRGPGGPPSR
jgi:DNA-3-methyladenine glycosylase I